MTTEIEVKLLGTTGGHGPHGGVEFEGAKQRRLFVALALRAPEAVSVDELVEAVWGDEAPDGREQALQKQVSRLRARLGEGMPVRRRAAGYALEIDREAIDSRRFESQLEQARVERADPSPRGRPARLGARAVAGTGAGRSPRRGVHAERDQAPRRAAAGSEPRSGWRPSWLAGRAADLVARAAGARGPSTRCARRLRGQLMLALYRGGRQADALEVMREGSPAAGRRAGARARAGAAPPRGDDPRPRSRAGRRRGRRRPRRRRCRHRRA